jgi:tetratricopeptide (TPR) repeat protein
VPSPADPFATRGPDPFATRDPNAGMAESSTRDGDVTPDTALESDLVGDVAGCRIFGEIARGGMGVVYRAHDPALNRTVAVKVLQEKYRGRPTAAGRFLDEAQITARLQHPAIPPVHVSGTLPDGRPFLVMKLIEGQTLDQLLKKRPDPDADRGQFVGMFQKVADAVAYAHASGVIHRDLKPQNVMVGAFGEVQVMDWGIAKEIGHETLGRHVTYDNDRVHLFSPDEETADYTPLAGTDEVRTTAGQAIGTPAYMAPEQARGEIDGVDRRTDVFALGGVLLQILTGSSPFGGQSGPALASARAGNLGPAFARLNHCGAETELVALCRQCLDPDPNQRPKDAGAVAAVVVELQTAAEERTRQADRDRVRAEGEAAGERRRRRWQVALAATLALLVLVGGAFAWRDDRRAASVRAADDLRQARANQEATTAIAELTALCDRGDQEIGQPAQWRLTLKAARAAHHRAAAAGPAAHDVRSHLTDATARLDRDEADCEIAEQCEQWLAALVDLVGGGADETAMARKIATLVERATTIVERLGGSIAAGPETVAAGIQAHRLRHAVTVVTAFVAEIRQSNQSQTFPSKDHPRLLPDPLMMLARQLLNWPDPFPEQVRSACAAADAKLVKQLLEGPGGRAVSSRELLVLYLGIENGNKGRPNNTDLLLLDEAIRRDPTDVVALFIRAGLLKDRTFVFLDPSKAMTRDEFDTRSLAACAAAVALRPEVPELWSQYGTRLAAGRLYQWAANCFRRAIDLDPNRGADFVSLAESLGSAGQPAEALAAYRTALTRFRPLVTSEWFRFIDVRIAAAKTAIAVARSGSNRLTPAEIQDLRREALRWLQELMSDPQRPTSYHLSNMQTDPEFQLVRDQERLAKLPDAEANEWRAFWALVRGTRGAQRIPGAKFESVPSEPGPSAPLPPPRVVGPLAK